jgi:hypothetical protein
MRQQVPPKHWKVHKTTSRQLLPQQIDMKYELHFNTVFSIKAIILISDETYDFFSGGKY